TSNASRRVGGLIGFQEYPPPAERRLCETTFGDLPHKGGGGRRASGDVIGYLIVSSRDPTGSAVSSSRFIMVRIALRALAFSVLAAAVATTGLAQQANAPDRVYYIDKKDGSIRDVEATIKASPTGYQITPINDKKVITVSAADLVRVVPGNIPGYERAGIMEPVNFETKKEWEKAR